MYSVIKQKLYLLAITVFCVSLYILPETGLADEVVAYRGTFLDMIGDPWQAEDESETARFVQDGLLVIENGVEKSKISASTKILKVSTQT